MKILFYFCTKQTEPKNTLAFISLTKIKNSTNNNFDIQYISNNTEGLSKNYNKVLCEKSELYDYIVFLHDDVYVDDYNINSKLAKAHENFDIVGLAGGLSPKIQTPALWHLMCGGFNSGNLRGAVAHFYTEDKIAMTSFGPTPDRVAILDGLFLSVSTDAISKVDWKFNENYSFHHYDIASSLDANSKKLKLGVTPIWVIHKSPGLLNINDSLFASSQQKFISEYS